MSGVHNPNPIPGTPVVPRLMQVQGGTVPAAPPAPTVAGDQLATSVDANQLANIRQQLRMGSPVDAAMAMYQLEALATTHRDHAVPLLIEQLNAGGTNARAAIDILARLKAPEAAPFLQQLANGSPDPGIRSAASAANAIMNPAPAPAPTAPVNPQSIVVGPAGPTPAVPGAPTVPGAPNPAAPVADTSGLLPRLLNPAQAPMAAVEMSKLPTPQLLALTGRLNRDFMIEPKTLDLITTILAKRLREPGVPEQLAEILRKGRTDAPGAYGKAAIALMSLSNPAFLPDILRAVATRNTALNPVKRAIIDQLAKDPNALAHPAAGAVFGAVLKANEQPELAASASHALGLIKNAQARDALAASPLFMSPDPRLRMRALWDLGAHPAPYPPNAVAALQRLAADADKQVQAKAKELLQKKA